MEVVFEEDAAGKSLASSLTPEKHDRAGTQALP